MAHENVKNFSAQGSTLWEVNGTLHVTTAGTLDVDGTFTAGLLSCETLSASSAVSGLTVSATSTLSGLTVSATSNITSGKRVQGATVVATSGATVAKTLTLSSGGGKLVDTDGKIDDIRVPMTATKTGGSKDPGFTVFQTGATTQGVFTYMFDAGTEEELYFAVQIPHTHKTASPLSAHVHWTPTSTGTGNVRWGLEYTKANTAATFGATTTLKANGAAAGNKKHTMTVLGNISTTSFTSPSPMLICRLFREAASTLDTYAADAALLEIDFHTRFDSLGSTT